MADTTSIDAAVVALLDGDSQMQALAPGGAYLDIAPQGVSEPFVIVSMTSHEDAYQIGAQAYESVLYLVKVVQAAKSPVAAQAAATRAHALLQFATLSITGYRCMSCVREERVAYVEVDAESDRRFQHRGGYYRVIAEATA